MEEDIIPIDGLIASAESDAGAKVFGGPEKAKGAAEHGREIKQQEQSIVTARHASYRSILRRKRSCWDRNNIEGILEHILRV